MFAQLFAPPGRLQQRTGRIDHIGQQLRLRQRIPRRPTLRRKRHQIALQQKLQMLTHRRLAQT